MTLGPRIDRLERGGPVAFTVLDELLAQVAAQGLRSHERPAGIAPADPGAVTAALDALRQTPSLAALPRGAWA